MSETPFDPSTDPLLGEFAQLGVPVGGAPASSGAALLAQAAAVPVVAGLAGMKLYGLLAATLMVGAGGGGLIVSNLSPASIVTANVVQVAESESPAPEPKNTSAPQATAWEPDFWTPPLELAPTAPAAPAATAPNAPPRTIARARRAVPAPRPQSPEPIALLAACPEPTASVAPAGLGTEATDDDWIPAPGSAPTADLDVADPIGAQEPSTTEEPELVDAIEPDESRSAAPSTASSTFTRSAKTVGLLPAEGRARVGLGGGVFLFPNETAAPDLAIGGGLQLLSPGPAPAAALLAVNAEGGMASQGGRALGTFSMDGEFGVALRPPGIARIELSGLGGMRLLEQHSEELVRSGEDSERRDEHPTETTTVAAFPTFGGRVALVLGDRRRSPLSFRISLMAQGMARVERATTIVPGIGGTLGLDIALPEPKLRD